VGYPLPERSSTTIMADLDKIMAFDEARCAVFLADAAAKATAAGIRPLQLDQGKVPRPQCDWCSAVSRSRCGKCYSVCYCSRECQRQHWKVGGHKAECSTLKARVAGDAAHVLKMLWPPTPAEAEEQDDANPEVAYARMRWASDNLLDNEVAFELAYQGGLNDALRSLFLEDTRKMEARYAADIPCSWTSLAVCSLFRAQRHSRAGTGSFGKADGERIAAYVRSHPEAWSAWLGACVELARCLFSDAVKFNPPLVPHAHRAARDAWSFLNLALIQPEVGRSILVEGRQGAATAATLRKARVEIEGAWNEDSSTDPGGTICGNIGMVTGMVNVWCDRFIVQAQEEEEAAGEGGSPGNQGGGKVPLLPAGESFRSLLSLTGHQADMFDVIHFPCAEASINKGGFLSSAETKAAIAAAQAAQKPRGRAAGKRKGKKGKKGKKGRR